MLGFTFQAQAQGARHGREIEPHLWLKQACWLIELDPIDPRITGKAVWGNNSHDTILPD